MLRTPRAIRLRPDFPVRVAAMVPLVTLLNSDEEGLATVPSCRSTDAVVAEVIDRSDHEGGEPGSRRRQHR